MGADIIELLTRQLDEVISDFAAMRTASQHKDLSDLPKDDRQGLMTRAVAAVHRISGQESTYSAEIKRIVTQNPAIHVHASSVIGVVKALRHDVAAGYLRTVIELAHAELFSDFLEMATHLLDSGYKDAAAVVGGSALEGHLRELCKKHRVPIESGGKPRKADALNADLAKATAYSGLDLKNVTAWLGLRNKAAHGEYASYGPEQVALLIASVRDFITRTAA